MQDSPSAEPRNATAKLFIMQLTVLLLFEFWFLGSFYSSASSEEVAWSILFMPLLLAFVGSIWCAAALPLLAAYTVRKFWAWLLVPISLFLPYQVFHVLGKNPLLNVTELTGELQQRFEWWLPIAVWLVSSGTIGYLEYRIHQATLSRSTSSGNNNE